MVLRWERRKSGKRRRLSVGPKMRHFSSRRKSAATLPTVSGGAVTAVRNLAAQFAEYARGNPQQAAELKAIWAGDLPADWEQGIPHFEPDAKGMATRVSSGKVLNQLVPHFPWLVGGSADLAPSNMTLITAADAGHLQAGHYGGRNLHFGIREHAMAAAANGMALGGLRPYCGTFFVFTDYMRPAMRLAALMRQGVIYVLTHDSIGLGEDGPTHQPVEQLAACRAIPRLLVFRPADANEVAESYRAALRTTASRPASSSRARTCRHSTDRDTLPLAASPAAAMCCSIRRATRFRWC